jgi:hypothetical protein
MSSLVAARDRISRTELLDALGTIANRAEPEILCLRREKRRRSLTNLPMALILVSAAPVLGRPILASAPPEPQSRDRAGPLGRRMTGLVWFSGL